MTEKEEKMKKKRTDGYSKFKLIDILEFAPKTAIAFVFGTVSTRR